MNFKKTSKIIDDLVAQLFIIEGEITDLLTRETMQNLNHSNQKASGAIAIGSALAGQIGYAALAGFAASDEGIEVSDFAVEITDQNNEKHYFKGCFPVVVFNKGDKVKIVAKSYNEKYRNAVSIIDKKYNYIWTEQEVIKGRIRYRIWGMKFFGVLGCLCICVCIFILLFIENGIQMLTDKYGIGGCK